MCDNGVEERRSVFFKLNKYIKDIKLDSVYHMDGKDYFVTHAYSIKDNGDAKLVVVELEWSKDGWPIVELPE